MAATTIRIRPAAHRALKELAEMTGQSLQDVLDEAIEERRRQLYLQGLNDDYTALNADPKARAALDKELEIWDRTNADGLEDQ